MESLAERVTKGADKDGFPRACLAGENVQVFSEFDRKAVNETEILNGKLCDHFRAVLLCHLKEYYTLPET